PCAHPIRSLSRSDPPRSVLPPPSLHDALPIWSRFHDRLFDLLSGYSLVHRRLVRARARRHRLRHLPPSESRTRAAGARLLRTATEHTESRARYGVITRDRHDRYVVFATVGGLRRHYARFWISSRRRSLTSSPSARPPSAPIHSPIRPEN